MGGLRKIFGKGGGKVIGTIVGTIIGTMAGNPVLGAQIGVAIGSGADTVARNNQIRDNRRTAEKDLELKQRAEQERLDAIKANVRQQVQAARQVLQNEENTLAQYEQEQRALISSAENEVARQENELRQQIQLEQENIAQARMAWQEMINNKNDDLDKQVHLILLISECCAKRNLTKIPEYVSELDDQLLLLIADELLHLCDADDVETMSWLISSRFKQLNEAKPLQIVEQQSQALLFALRVGNDRGAIAAIENGADVNAILQEDSCYSGYRAIHCAVHWGGLEPLNKLLLNGADITAVNSRRQNVLLLNVWNGYQPKCRKVLDYLLVNYPRAMHKQLLDTDENGSTPLHATVMNAYLDVNASIEIATKLIRFGANVDHKDNYGITAQVLAQVFNQESLAKTIQEEGEKQLALRAQVSTNTNTREQQLELDERLCKASWSNNLVELSNALKDGANVHAQSQSMFSQFPALLIAAHWGNLEAFKILMQHGADLEVTNSSHQNLLYLTVWNYQMPGCRQILDYLLKTYPEQMRKQLLANNCDQQTPLHAVSVNAYIDLKAMETVAIKLIKFGVCTNQKDKHGLTASQLAVKRKQFELAMLIDKYESRMKRQGNESLYKTKTLFKRSPDTLVNICLHVLNNNQKLIGARKKIFENKVRFFPANLVPHIKPIEESAENRKNTIMS